MLKFGDLIDLKILDALEPTKQVLEMRQKFKHEERESIKKVYLLTPGGILYVKLDVNQKKIVGCQERKYQNH